MLFAISGIASIILRQAPDVVWQVNELQELLKTKGLDTKVSSDAFGSLLLSMILSIFQQGSKAELVSRLVAASAAAPAAAPSAAAPAAAPYPRERRDINHMQWGVFESKQDPMVDLKDIKVADNFLLDNAMGASGAAGKLILPSVTIRASCRHEVASHSYELLMSYHF